MDLVSLSISVFRLTDPLPTLPRQTQVTYLKVKTFYFFVRLLPTTTTKGLFHSYELQ